MRSRRSHFDRGGGGDMGTEWHAALVEAVEVVVGALAVVDEEEADRIAGDLEALAARAEQELGTA